jgi:signal transduction histidine kinase
MRRITTRFVMLIASAAIAPLVVYGAVSILGLRDGIRASVREGNLRIAQQIATQIEQYMTHNQRVLRSVGLEMRTTALEPWQQSRILKDFVLDFPEFREISLFDAGGRLLATSRALAPATSVPEPSAARGKDTYVAPLTIDDDILPTTTIAVRIAPSSGESGWVVGEIALEELWRMVDRIRVGSEGYAMLLSEDRRLIAHGDPDEKRHVASPAQAGDRLPELQLLDQMETDPAASASGMYANTYDDSAGEKLGAVARVQDLNWMVIVEQPTAEAFGITERLQRQLLVSIALALLGTVVLGWLWGRSFITRIFALTRATRAIAAGRMDERVAPSGRDEIRQLGDAFNSMADRLVELQEDVRKQERQAMFGRIAAGLVHDLSHPIQNIGNSCKLILKMFDDIEYRDTFKRTVEREMVVIKRVLDDLRNIARPIPLERFPVEVNRSIAEVVESMQQHAETAGLTLRAELGPEPLFIEGDVFALGRVYRNLIINAIQATAPGGLVVVTSEARDDRVQVRVYDTGCGIPPDRLAAVFEDFVTTKRRGLGLGLAISRKIVEQLGGQITVASEVGKGTTFVLDFPRTRPRPIALVAG